MKWQQQQCFLSENDHHLQSMFTAGLIDKDSSLNIVKPDAGMDECWAGLDGGQLGYGCMNQSTVLKLTDDSAMEADHMFVNGSSTSVSVSPKKRKLADKGETLQVSKITRKNSISINNSNNNINNKEASTNTSSKDKSKVSEVQKPDYIHVRARRGQATDSHSLAERVRREKISERMKYLQDLVPGCNKITGKAGMLDENINYVQPLQKQEEFLSMKLPTGNPELDFKMDNVFTKEMFESSTTEFPAVACSSVNSAYFDQLNPLDQVVSYHGFDMGINSAEMGLRRSISAPISIPEIFMDSSCYNVISSDLSTLFFQL